MALQPLFAHIPHAHLIHVDLIVATRTTCKQAISNADITLNPSKCTFGASNIEFWGIRVGSARIRPDPAKVEALNHITPPHSKEEVLCMMQSNADFIPNFLRHESKLKELAKRNIGFVWTKEHQTANNATIDRFKANALLEYFDMGKDTLFSLMHPQRDLEPCWCKESH